MTVSRWGLRELRRCTVSPDDLMAEVADDTGLLTGDDGCAFALDGSFHKQPSAKLNETLEERMEHVSDEALLVKKIAADGFLDAIDTWGCLDLLEKGNVAAITHRIEQVGAGKAATIVRKALFLRLLVTIERAFDYPSPKHQDDWNTRIAFKLLDDQAVFEKVATLGNRSKLEQARDPWKCLDTGTRREQLREHRNKVVVHQGQPK